MACWDCLRAIKKIVTFLSSYFNFREVEPNVVFNVRVDIQGVSKIELDIQGVQFFLQYQRGYTNLDIQGVSILKKKENRHFLVE